MVSIVTQTGHGFTVQNLMLNILYLPLFCPFLALVPWGMTPQDEVCRGVWHAILSADPSGAVIRRVGRPLDWDLGGSEAGLAPLGPLPVGSGALGALS